MTREELIQTPEYWKTLYENECERLGIKPILVFSKQERQVICWGKLTEDEKSELMLDIVSTRKPIDEEKLGELAEEFANKYSIQHSQQSFDLQSGFQAGYRKAKEEQV